MGVISAHLSASWFHFGVLRRLGLSAVSSRCVAPGVLGEWTAALEGRFSVTRIRSEEYGI